MFLTALNHALKNGEDGKFHIICTFTTVKEIGKEERAIGHMCFILKTAHVILKREDKIIQGLEVPLEQNL